MKLKDVRSAKGYSQKEIADAIGCSVTVYSRYETGSRQPPIDVLIQLADFYGITLDALVGRVPIDVVAIKENAPPLGKDEYENVIEPDEAVPPPDDLDRRIVELIRKELEKKGL